MHLVDKYTRFYTYLTNVFLRRFKLHIPAEKLDIKLFDEIENNLYEMLYLYHLLLCLMMHG